MDFRIVFQGEKGRYTFYPKWIIDYAKYQNAEERRDWLSQAIVSDWSDQLLLPKASCTFHLILECSSWKTIKEDKFCVSVEYFHKRKWHTYERCGFFIDEWVREELQRGSAFGVGGCNTHRKYDDCEEEMLEGEIPTTTALDAPENLTPSKADCDTL